MQNEKRNYEVIIDRHGQTDYLTPTFHQFDTETAKLTFRFLSNGSPWNVPYTRLVLIIKKPDGKEVYQDIETFSGNTVEIILNNQALTVAGTLKCQIRMYQDSKLESTQTFEVKVKPSIGNNNPMKSEDEYEVLHQLMMDVDKNINKNNQVVNELVEQTNQSVSESIRLTTESMNQNIQANNQALMEALAQIDESELVRLKGLIELLQQNKLGVHDKASDSALLNGVVEDVEATANTIVKRNANKNVNVGNAVGFHDSEGNFVGALMIDSDGKAKQSIPQQGTTTIHTQQEFPIEKRIFTPVCKQQGGASWTMDTAISFGKYYRVGNLVYIQGRARTTAKPGVSGGKFVIAGLPFTIYNSGQTLDLGIHSGLIYHDSAKELKIYLQSGTSEIQFYYVRTEYSYQVKVVI